MGRRTYTLVISPLLSFQSKVKLLSRNLGPLPGLAEFSPFSPDRRGIRISWSFSRDEDKHKTVGRGYAGIRRGKIDGQNLRDYTCACAGRGDAWWHPRDSAEEVICYRLQAAIFRASRLLESLNNMGGDDL
jgi:hypothetical protein